MLQTDFEGGNDLELRPSFSIFPKSSQVRRVSMIQKSFRKTHFEITSPLVVMKSFQVGRPFCCTLLVNTFTALLRINIWRSTIYSYVYKYLIWQNACWTVFGTRKFDSKTNYFESYCFQLYRRSSFSLEWLREYAKFPVLSGSTFVQISW